MITWFSAFKQLAAVALAFALLSASQAAAQNAVSVSNGTQLQDAINSVPDGGVIELASGTYSPPGDSFTIFPDINGGSKSFTIRAAQGATANLTNNSSSGIVRLTTPKLITFQRLNFVNGKSQGDFGSVISMNNAEANFLDCTFQNNTSASSAGGGGVRMQNSAASFSGCKWANNTATSFGAALTAEVSSIFINNSQFLFNRIDVPNHTFFSAGGAIHVNSCTLRVANSRFDSNAAAYVGGAIYALGPWSSDYSKPVTDVVVSNCLFVNNTATRLSSDTLAPEHGGAVMLEDQTYGRFYNCRFVNNTAKQGGALASYRARIDVQNGVFQDNRALMSGRADEGFGGAISVISDDNSDASTNNGATNRPSGQLAVTDTLIRGTQGVVTAGAGGGIFVAGDLHANFGVAVQQNGTSDTNRALVTLTRVAFADLTAANGAPGNGGAFSGDFIKLNGDSLIVENCNSDNQGGALRFVQQSSVTVSNSTIAGCSTNLLGGGIAMVGGDIHINNSNIVDNGITGQGSGRAFWLSPQQNDGTVPDTDLTGEIQNCVINGGANGSILIYDSDPYNVPVNRVQYNANKISNPDPTIYFNDKAGYLAVDRLNALSLHGAPKSTAPNSYSSTLFVDGAILLVPPVVLTSGAPGETTPLQSYLVYAASGGSVTLDGNGKTNTTDVLATTSANQHTLTVAGSGFSTTPLPHVALNISTRLPVGTGDNALIGGFIIVGNSPKRVLVRAVGPSLPVAGALPDTTLQLFRGQNLVAQNDDWASTQTGGLIAGAQDVEIISTGAPPTSSLESAIVVTLDPGPYTAVVRGKNNTTGNAQVEIFDVDAIQNSTLANISTRGLVQTGDNVMIGGFIYAGGEGATRVALRGLGPSLPVSSPLADPTLDLVNAQGTPIDSNDNWSSGRASELQAAGLAPTNAAESAIYRDDLAPGSYTAVLRGKNGGTGIGLVEVYVF